MPESSGNLDGDSGRIDAEERFLVDSMCGKLARYLRMCGYDAAYTIDRYIEDDDAVLTVAESENRRIVTRDRDLAARARNPIALDARDVRDQLRSVSDAGVILELPDEPRRCGACNGPLARVPDGTHTPEYAPEPTDTPVWQCTECGQHFWRGSHWDDVAETLAGL